MTDWVVAVDNSLSILVQAGQDVRDVVGEEPDHFIDLAVSMELNLLKDSLAIKNLLQPLAVEHGCSHLSNSRGGHRPPMGVTVSLQTHFSNLRFTF